jgi:hypothetical protein
MLSRPSSPTPSDSSEEVILFHGRNKPATVTVPATGFTLPATAVTLPATAITLPATAVNPFHRRVKYTEPSLQLTSSAMPSLPASAVTLPATAVISSNEDAEDHFRSKVDEYRREMRAQARSGAPPAIVNPQRPSCHHHCKWDRSMEKGRVCAGDDCHRTIGKAVQFLMACHDCGLLACFTHQRKSTNHSSRSTVRGRRTGL